MAYRLGWMLVHSLWEGAAIAAMLALVLLFVPRRLANIRYLCNLLAMVMMITAFAVTLAISPRPAQLSPAVNSTIPALPMPVVLQTASPSVAPVQIPLDVAPSSPTPRVSPTQKINDWIAAASVPVARLWFAGVLLLGIWRTAAWFSVQRLRALQTIPADSILVATAKRLADRLNLTKPFEILISNFTETPMVIGWLRPVVLIPASALTGLSQSQLEAILVHELAHIRRHDYLVNLLQIVAETLLFYHPAIWWISRQIRLEREQACDDVAVSLCTDRHEYARSLAAIEEIRLAGSMAMAARGSGGQQMLARVRRILGAADDAPRWGLPMVVGLIVIGTAAVGLYSQSKADRYDHTPGTTQPFSLQNDAPRRSPFTAVRWRGDVAKVQYKDAWYGLVSINDIPVPKIMDYLKTSNDFAPQKHFAEDLVEVLRDMGKEPGKTVKLELEMLDTRQRVTIPDAEMTEENRRSVLMNGNSDQPADGLLPAGPDAAPPIGQDAAVAASSQEYQALVAQRKRLSDIKNRYDIERIQAEDDIKSKFKQLVALGGESVDGVASPTEMAMNRWVQEQIDLQTQKLTLDTDLAQLNEKKAKGELTPPVAKVAESNADVIRAKEAVEAAENHLGEVPDGDPVRIALAKHLDEYRQKLASARADAADHAMKDYEAELTWQNEKVTKRLDDIDVRVANLKVEITKIDDLKAALASRREDLATYKKFVVDYDHSLQEIDQTIRDMQPNQSTQIRPQPVPADGEFKFDVPFQKGATQFLDGDQITITSVKGTSADMESGICCVSGTYELGSHDRALLGAFVTAGDPKQAIGFYNATQTTTITKGKGTFTLLLPINVKGWPHVSFYDDKSSFGGSYIGTGDWVLRKWRGSKSTDTTQPAAK